MSFRRLEDVGFGNLEDGLYNCLKDTSNSGMKDISKRQFLLDMLAR